MANVDMALDGGAEFQDVSHGVQLFSPEDEEAEEEVIASSEGPQDTFSMVLSELEVLMMDETLNEKMDDFTREHCDVFDDSDENKLEYTTLFQQYTQLVETYIEERLGASVASFDMTSFCAQLSEKAAQDDGLLDHPALEMLTAYSDFEGVACFFLLLSTKNALSVCTDVACGAL